MKSYKYDLVYKTSITPFFPICFLGKNFGCNLKRLAGLNVRTKDPIIVIVKEGVTNWFFPKSLSKVGEKVIGKLLSDDIQLNKIKKNEKEFSDILLKAIEVPVASFYNKKRLTKEGEKKISILFHNYSEYGYFIDIPGFLFQLYFTSQIRDKIFKVLKNKTNQEKETIYNLLLSSSRKTNYERFLFSVADIIKVPSRKKIESTAEKYFWVIHDYLGTIVNAGYIKKLIKEIKAKKSRHFIQELRDVHRRIKTVNRQILKLRQKERRELRIIQEILYLYNERKKAVLSRVNIFIRKLIQFKFPGATMDQLHDIYQLSPVEILKLLKGKRIKNLKARSRQWIYEMKNGRIEKGSKRYLSLIAVKPGVGIIKGLPASTGNLKGRVQIILNISQIPAFMPGKILVAPFTNVNYLPVMRKAKAILTETGGLTSHAAIVSRELKIPCIVGINSLMALLKDDDLVQVDADTGEVRVL